MKRTSLGGSNGKITSVTALRNTGRKSDGAGQPSTPGPVTKSVQRRVSFSSNAQAQDRLKRSPLIADVPVSSPKSSLRAGISPGSSRENSSKTSPVSSESQPRVAIEPVPFQIPVIEHSVPDISITAGSDQNIPQTPRSEPSSQNFTQKIPPFSSNDSKLQSSSSALSFPNVVTSSQRQPNQTFFAPIPERTFLTVPPRSAPLLTFDDAGFINLPSVNSPLRQVNQPAARYPGGLPGYNMPMQLDFGFPFTSHLSSPSDPYLIQRIQSQETVISVLSAQLLQVIELYNGLTAETLTNNLQTNETSTQTELEDLSRNSIGTMVDSELLQFGNRDNAFRNHPENSCEMVTSDENKPANPSAMMDYRNIMANVHAILKKTEEYQQDASCDVNQRSQHNNPVVSDISITCGYLAKQYFRSEMPLNNVPQFHQEGEISSSFGMFGNDVSIATQNYLERYGLAKNLPRNGFLRTESIIEWREEEEREEQMLNGLRAPERVENQNFSGRQNQNFSGRPQTTKDEFLSSQRVGNDIYPAESKSRSRNRTPMLDMDQLKSLPKIPTKNIF